MVQSYRFFANKDCRYYPCHKMDGEDINCLFCFCPLYAMGKECGGDFSIMPNGTKDCSACSFIHSDKGYDYVMEMLGADIL